MREKNLICRHILQCVPILYICILCLSVSLSVNNFKLNDFLSVCLSVTKANFSLSAVSSSMIFHPSSVSYKGPCYSIPNFNYQLQLFSVCLSVTTDKRRDRKPFKEDCWHTFVTDGRMDEKSFRWRLLIDRPTYRPYLVSKLGHSSNVSIFKSKFHPMQSKSKNLTENLQANASYKPIVLQSA